VLTDKLRKLEVIGLIARDPGVPTRAAPYRLTPAGEQLMPTLMSLWQWAEKWVPEDPAMAERDPVVILWWLRHRVDDATLPERHVAIEFAMGGTAGEARSWLLLARGTEPELCLEDPLLSQERYVYVEADAADLSRVARGICTWTDALVDGSVRVFGEPEYVAALPDWFLPGQGHHRLPDPDGSETSAARLERHATRDPGG
jgi:hypothetical protein